MKLERITVSQETTNGSGASSLRKETTRLPSSFSLSNLQTTEVATEFAIRSPRGRDRHTHRDSTTKPVVFVDGEGANVGAPELYRGKSYQRQHYALLSAVFSTGEYRRIIGQYGTGRLRTLQCLEFLLDLPRTHIAVGYGIDYDVQQMLYDVPAKYLLRLHEKGYVRWKEFVLTYRPRKSFSVSLIQRKGEKKLGRGSRLRKSCTWWDMQGFFQTRFDKAVAKWEVASAEDVEFLERMKLSRATFAGINAEQLEYNKLEGVLGVRIFERVRAEWTSLRLPVRRFDGAGAIASAMFAKNRVDSFLIQRNPIPTDVMLRAYIGGRFDFSRQGFIGDASEYDINSAYPNVARNLPCLTHSIWEYTRTYDPSKIALWHVQWSLEDSLWSPFPYRDHNGRIRYHSTGDGWYYNFEVERALQLYPNIKVLEGYTLICGCEHKPFSWIEEYYAERQRLKLEKNFGEQVLKLGLNSVYGKLAQSKGHTPRFQCLIWAGMITSGTRAMILEAIAHEPSAVSVTATDAVISSAPLPLPIDPTELGAWDAKRLSQVCVIGNGLYHSTDGLKVGNRGYGRDHLGHGGLDWDRLRDTYRNTARPFTFDVPATTFFGFVPAHTQGIWSLRCTWEYSRKQLKVDVPEWKEERDGWLYPLPNPSSEPSAPARIAEDNLRLDTPELDWLLEEEKLE